jgi:hypothetical protein
MENSNIRQSDTAVLKIRRERTASHRGEWWQEAGVNGSKRVRLQ